MNKKKVFCVSMALPLVIVLCISVYLQLLVGCAERTWDDAKIVKEVPSGFVHLPKGRGHWENGMEWLGWETQISFLDANGVCIYQTGFDNNDFIVKYEDEYYVCEEKLQEILDIIDSSSEQQE